MSFDDISGNATRWLYILINGFNNIDDDATRWLCFDIYIYVCLRDNDYVMNFYFMVILRSTMGPYRQPMIKVAYGEILFSLHRSCMGDDSSGRVVGVST